MNFLIKGNILVLLILASSLITSCDKVEDNGDFAGLWQMTEWKIIESGKIRADKNNMIFYAVQLDLMLFGYNGGSDYLSRFKRTPDSLILGTAYKHLRSQDTIVAYTELAKYGVPANGKFAIDKLTKKAMVLRSDEAILTFRKY